MASLQKRSHKDLSIDAHTSGSAVVLQLWSSLTADMLMAAIGEVQERSTRRGLLVYRAWLDGSQLPWGA